MRHTMIVAGAMLVLGSRAARADQCEIVTEAQARKAIEIINATNHAFASYCAPCGEKEAKGDVAKSLDIRHTKIGISLVINGSPVDLAYTYYAVADGRFRNLAFAVRCEVQDVPEFVTLGKVSPRP